MHTIIAKSLSDYESGSDAVVELPPIVTTQSEPNLLYLSHEPGRNSTYLFFVILWEKKPL